MEVKRPKGKKVSLELDLCSGGVKSKNTEAEKREEDRGQHSERLIQSPPLMYVPVFGHSGFRHPMTRRPLLY